MVHVLHVCTCVSGWLLSCLADMRAITAPEFFHWLHHDEHAANAQLKPGPANTIFTPSTSESRLQLVPPPPPGGDAAAVPRGSLVEPSNERGWSWADVQVRTNEAWVNDNGADPSTGHTAG